MPSLKASGQGSGEPAHLQLRHCPTDAGLRELDHALVTDLIVVERKSSEGWQCVAADEAAECCCVLML